jgi:hypothetical protein
MGRLGCWIWVPLAAMFLFGCDRGPQKPQGTGAEECAQEYFEALMRRDWARAYSSLDATSQKQCNLSQFSQLAQSFCNSLGFEPSSVHVRACEEHGNEATAHVALLGQSASQGRRSREAVTLVQGTDGWRVLLPQNFGRSHKR